MSSGYVLMHQSLKCPTTAFIYGWGKAESHDNVDATTATAAAKSAAADLAKVDIDLRFIGYECPTPACQTKEVQTLHVSITRTSTHFQWVRWIMNLFSTGSYRGEADYEYMIRINCK